MPRVTTKGQVTIPKRVREALGIEPGDEVAFEQTESGYTLRKEAPTTADGEDPFENTVGARRAMTRCPPGCADLGGSTLVMGLTDPIPTSAREPSRDNSGRDERASRDSV